MSPADRHVAVEERANKDINCLLVGFVGDDQTNVSLRTVSVGGEVLVMMMMAEVVVAAALRKQRCFVPENGANLIRELFEGHERSHFQLKFGLLNVDDIHTRFVGDALQSAWKPGAEFRKEQKGFVVFFSGLTHKCLMPTISARRMASLLLSK
jgi:hypothetical protein